MHYINNILEEGKEPIRKYCRPEVRQHYQFRDHGAAACELNIELRQTAGKQRLLY